MSFCDLFMKIFNTFELYTNDTTISKNAITGMLIHKLLRMKGLSTILIEMVNTPNTLLL